MGKKVGNQKKKKQSKKRSVSSVKVGLTPSKSEQESEAIIFEQELEEGSSGEDISVNSLELSQSKDDSFLSCTYDSVSNEFFVDDLENAEDAAVVVTSNKKRPRPDTGAISRKSKICKVRQDINNSKIINDVEMSWAPPDKSKTIRTDTSTSDTCSSNDYQKRAQYCYTNDGTIIIIKENDTIYFHGLLTLSVLHGEVEILGHIINRNKRDVNLYSLRGSSLLYVKNITKNSVNVSNFLNELNLSNVDITPNCSILLCKKLEDPNITFIEKHISQQILPKNDNTKLPRAVFEPRDDWNLIKVNEEWDNFISEIGNKTKLLLCGGKGVGKSTFLRYAINRLIMKFAKIRVIDLDPGQSEFSVPGCISIFDIRKPVFGVNYTHLKIPKRSFLSNINIGFEPMKYVETVKFLLDDEFEDVPTLINFMGFSQGIGINILSAVTVHVQPTDILQINSKNIKKNYKFALSPDVISKNAELFVHPDDVKSASSCKLHEMAAMTDENDGWSAQPRQLREMSILSYLAETIDSNSIFNTSLPLHRVNLSTINICDLNGEKIHPSAVNANLVALCTIVNTKQSIFQCCGWGIVRGIDMTANILVLLTSEKSEVLERVTHLVLSSISLPPSVYMTPDEVIGEMPYVIKGDLMSFGQIPKRSHIPVKT